MLVVAGTPQDAASHLDLMDGVTLAAVNSARQFVLGGHPEKLTAMAESNVNRKAAERHLR